MNDDFLRSYITAILPEGKSVLDIDVMSLNKIIRECEQFQTEHDHSAFTDKEAAIHFLNARNGHDETGLFEQAIDYGEVHVHVDPDGMVHV